MAQLSQSIAHYYHQRTKYAPEVLAAKQRDLDWQNQPFPFKEYKIGTTFDLKPYLSEEAEQDRDPDVQQWRRLSRLFLCSYGLTAKLPAMFGSFVYLRTAPSAGGLYPAEVYLISRGTSILPPGLYHYQTQTHSLLRFWDSIVWSELQIACFQHPALANTSLAIITSAVFQRSVWRYEDRAYRRIFLDTGHLLGNIELASSLTDYRAYLIGGFQDQALNRLLYLDSAEESVITVVAIADLQKPQTIPINQQTALASEITTNYPEIADGELLSYFHQTTEIEDYKAPSVDSRKTASSLEDKYNFPFCLKIQMNTQPIDWGQYLTGLENTILKRRSTRAYTGADITLDELKALLHFTYQPQAYQNQGLDAAPDYFDLSLIETFIAVSGVKGLEEGCYYYAPKAQELRQIRFKNFRRELHYLCLGQELGRDAGAVLFHTADLDQAVAKYGDRVYRYLHIDAGHLGQRLNLAAIHLNLGVSGIGGFFDDQVNEVLGIPDDEAVLYITTLGRCRKG